MLTMERALKKVFKEIAAMDHVPSYEELKARYFPADVSEMESTAPAAADEEEAETAPKKKKAPPAKKAENAKSDDGEKGKCQGVTVKGLPCKKNAIGGGCFCSVHKPKEDGDAKPAKKEKAAKKPKGEPLEEEASEGEAFGTPPPPKRTLKIKPPAAPKKTLPVHSHGPDEEMHDDCDMCQKHGNSASGSNPKYEVNNELKTRLATILGAIDGSDEDEEDEDLEAEAEALFDALDKKDDEAGAVFDELEEEGDETEGEDDADSYVYGRDDK